jgi:hypothetical protein
MAPGAGFGLTGAGVRARPDTGCSSSDDLLEVFSDGILVYFGATIFNMPKQKF